MTQIKLSEPIQGRISWQARDHIEGVGHASCYFCLRVFLASAITEWTDHNLTAICPYCGVDAVVAGKVKRATLRRWYCDSFDSK